jgi:hypothetical protein
MAEKLKITPAKGRPMLHWIGKKPLNYVKGFPAQIVEVFDPTRKMSSLKVPAYVKYFLLLHTFYTW